MGTLTRDTIVSEALQLAGDTSLTSRAEVWLNAWLRDEYRGWDWDFLRRLTTISLASGAVSATMALTHPTKARPKDVYVHRPAGTIGATLAARKRLTKVGFITGLEADRHPLLATTNDTGEPQRWGFDARDSAGLIYVWPRADQAYSLDVEWYETPADPTGTGVPLYPSDEVMIQAVFARALDHMQDPRAQAEHAKLEMMKHRVRAVERDSAGQYGYAPLDSRYFRIGGWTN